MPCRIRRKTNIVYAETCAVTQPYSDEHDRIHRRLRSYFYVTHRVKSQILVDFFDFSWFLRRFDLWEFKSTLSKGSSVREIFILISHDFWENMICENLNLPYMKVLRCEGFYIDVSWFLRRFDLWAFLITLSIGTAMRGIFMDFSVFLRIKNRLIEINDK